MEGPLVPISTALFQLKPNGGRRKENGRKIGLATGHCVAGAPRHKLTLPNFPHAPKIRRHTKKERKRSL